MPKKQYSDPAIDGEYAYHSNKTLVEDLFFYTNPREWVEVVRRRGEAAVPLLLELLKSPARMEREDLPKAMREYRTSSLQPICRAIAPFASAEILQAIEPYLTIKGGKYRAIAVQEIANLGIIEAKTVLKRLIVEMPGSVALGLHNALKEGRLDRALVLELFEPLLKAMERIDPNDVYKPIPKALEVLVWADRETTAKAYLNPGLLTRKNQEEILQAFCQHRDLFPSGLIGQMFDQAVARNPDGYLGFTYLCDARAEATLIKGMKSKNAHKSLRSRMALVERYAYGVSHEDPGPGLTPKEQAWLGDVWRERLAIIETKTFVWGDGIEQLIDGRHKEKWALCYSGLERLGAVKSIAMYKEMFEMLAPLTSKIKVENWFDKFTKLRDENAERFSKLERGMFDADGDIEKLLDEYLIRHRDVLLRNRGDGTWKQAR